MSIIRKLIHVSLHRHQRHAACFVNLLSECLSWEPTTAVAIPGVTRRQSIPGSSSSSRERRNYLRVWCVHVCGAGRRARAPSPPCYVHRRLSPASLLVYMRRRRRRRFNWHEQTATPNETRPSSELTSAVAGRPSRQIEWIPQHTALDRRWLFTGAIRRCNRHVLAISVIIRQRWKWSCGQTRALTTSPPPPSVTHLLPCASCCALDGRMDSH